MHVRRKKKAPTTTSNVYALFFYQSTSIDDNLTSSFPKERKKHVTYLREVVCKFGISSFAKFCL